MSESDVSTSAVAIVTAAGEGIGEATAHAFADAGYDLVLVDINAEALDATAADLPSGVAEVVVADVADEAAVAGPMAPAIVANGRVEVLVNVVGGGRLG